MAIESVANLIDVLRQHQLLSPVQLDELTRDLQSGSGVPADFAADLVQRGWLTPYQVKQIFLGKAGDLVLGQYVLLDLLGEGGMGQVFKARHRRLDRVDALKVIRPEHLASPGVLARFLQEARAAARLAHPNVVTIHDADEVGDRHFLAMEYVVGTDLAHLVRDRGPLPVAVACDYIWQAALGLEHAFERDLVHRDIKPSNLLVTADRAIVKILDMGLARLSQPTDSHAGDLTQTGMVMGTPDYMAPEQAMNSHDVDIRADIYSLGCTFYFLLTGQAPFPGGSLTQKLLWHQKSEPPPVESLRPDLPAGVVEVVRRMMAKRPEDRYQTPLEVAEALEPFRHDDEEAATLSAPKRQPPGKTVAAAPTKVPAGATVEYVAEAAGPPPAVGSVSATLRTPPSLPAASAAPKPLASLSPLPTVTKPPASALAAPEQTAVHGMAATTLLAEESPDQVAVRKHHYLIAVVCAAVLLVSLAWTAVPWVKGLLSGGLPEEPAGEVRRYPGHRDAVWAVAVSPDGRQLLSAGGDKVLRLWDVDRGEELRVFHGHKGKVLSVVFSPDGHRALSGGSDATVRLWDVDKGEEVLQFKGHTQPVFSVALSPDGQRALSASGQFETRFGKKVHQDCTVRLWDVATGTELRRFEGHTGVVFRVLFSPDGRTALSASLDHTMRLWNLDTGETIRQFEGIPDKVKAVAFTPDGNRILSGSDDEVLRLWDVATGKELWAVPTRAGSVLGIAVAPDGRRALTASGDHVLHLWDVEQGTELDRLTGHRGPVTCVAFLPDGRFAVTGSEDKTVRLWRLPR